MGAPWAGPLSDSPPGPRARPLGPPSCPSPGRFAYAELTRAYAQLTRRIVLCSQRKEGNSHRRTAEGPGGGGAGAKGPGGPVSVEGNCIRVEYHIGQHIGRTNVFLSDFHSMSFSLLPTAYCLLPNGFSQLPIPCCLRHIAYCL